MATKFDLIEQQLEEYRIEAIKYHQEYLNDVMKYLKSMPNITTDEEFSQGARNLSNFVKNEIYPYIINNKDFLNKEFLNRANYYDYLSNAGEYGDLWNSLFNDINKLYSFIDEKIILNYEEQNSRYFLTPFLKAIKSLNTQIEFEDEGTCYKLLIELMQEKNNYFKLSFNKNCQDYCDQADEENILNIKEIIAQYEDLMSPFNWNSASNLYLIKKNQINEFQKTLNKYVSNLEKLKELLTKRLKPEKLYSFYHFNRLASCRDINCNFCLEEDGYLFRCDKCFDSVASVIEELIQFIKAPKGLHLTKKEMEILDLILGGLPTSEIALKLFIAENTVYQHINSIIKKANSKGLEVENTKDLLIIFNT